ncbi:MAG: hypothetical protein LIO57_08395 [Oscillospiraceae bacterium]|nr:hypothetical protein [Oscillospiraceae bacterium]
MIKQNKTLIIHCIVMALIYIVISSIPPTEPLTSLGIKVLAIVVAAIYGWCTIDTIIPSIAALVMYGVVMGTGSAVSFMSGSGAYVTVMILAMMLFSGILIHTGLARAVAEKIINSKIAVGRPWVLTCLILVAALVLSMFIPGIAAVMIIWEMAIGIFGVVGFKKGDKWPAAMMLAITAAATFGMQCSHVGLGVISDFGVLHAIDESMSLPSFAFTASSVIMMIVFLILVMLILRYVIRPDTSMLKNYSVSSEKKPFTTDQKRALAIFIGFIVLVTLPDLLPASAVTNFLSGFGLIGWAFIAVGVALLIRNKDGTPFITIKQITDAGVFWGMLIMIASIQVICGSLSDESLGISAWLMELLSPIISGLSPFAFLAVFLAFALVVTNLLDNAVTLFVFTTIMYALTQSMGMNTLGVMAMLSHTAAFGMFLPASAPPITMLYGRSNEGWISKGQIFKTSPIYIIPCYISILLVGWFTMGWF